MRFFAGGAGFVETGGLDGASGLGGGAGVGELLNRSENQPAWPASIGCNRNAVAVAAATARLHRLAHEPDPAIVQDDGNTKSPKTSAVRSAPAGFNFDASLSH